MNVLLFAPGLLVLLLARHGIRGTVQLLSVCAFVQVSVWQTVSHCCIGSPCIMFKIYTITCQAILSKQPLHLHSMLLTAQTVLVVKLKFTSSSQSQDKGRNFSFLSRCAYSVKYTS